MGDLLEGHGPLSQPPTSNEKVKSGQTVTVAASIDTIPL